MEDHDWDGGTEKVRSSIIFVIFPGSIEKITGDVNRLLYTLIFRAWELIARWRRNWHLKVKKKIPLSLSWEIIQVETRN